MSARRTSGPVLAAAAILSLAFVIALVRLLVPQHGLTAGAAVSEWQTTGDQSQLLAPETGAVFSSASTAAAQQTIAVDDSRRYQQMAGFGATMTDSSAYVLERDMSRNQRDRLMQRIFSPSSGIGLNFLRVPIGASDFAPSDYTEDDVPAGHSDPTLRHFSIAPDALYVIPALRQALAVNPQIELLATPWSAPAWMKTTGSLIGGTLRNADVAIYARYLTRFVAAYAELGVPITALTMQNEPDFSPPSYPGMTLSEQQEAQVASLLAADLAAAGLHTQIIGFDSDWADAGFALRLLAGSAARFISGTAFHCYVGDPSQQLSVEAAAPTKSIYETECTGVESSPGFAANLVVGTRSLVIDAVRDYSRTVLLWNLVLDQRFGPHSGGCGDCVPNVSVSSTTGHASFNVEHYVLGQVSSFVKRGAYRIASTSPAGPFDSVAFANPDGTYVLVVLNTADSPGTFAVSWRGLAFTATIPAASVETFVWPSGGS